MGTDAVGKRGIILGIVIFIFKDVSYVFVKIVQRGVTISQYVLDNNIIYYHWTRCPLEQL